MSQSVHFSLIAPRAQKCTSPGSIFERIKAMGKTIKAPINETYIVTFSHFGLIAIFAKKNIPPILCHSLGMFHSYMPPVVLAAFSQSARSVCPLCINLPRLFKNRNNRHCSFMALHASSMSFCIFPCRRSYLIALDRVRFLYALRGCCLHALGSCIKVSNKFLHNISCTQRKTEIRAMVTMPYLIDFLDRTTVFFWYAHELILFFPPWYGITIFTFWFGVGVSFSSPSWHARLCWGRGERVWERRRLLHHSFLVSHLHVPGNEQREYERDMCDPCCSK